MKRTINLYQASLKPKKEKLPLSKVVRVNGAAAVILILICVVLSTVESSKQSANDTLTASVVSIQKDIDSLALALKYKRDTQKLKDKLASLKVTLKNKEELFTYLEHGELSFDATQYGEVMDDLASQHNPNLWLTRISINTDIIKLSGRTEQPSSIPTWLKQLQQSPFFKGKSFSAVNLKQVDGQESVKKFVISTQLEGEGDEPMATTL
ncbi:PilN domain-containing protein [Alteromonas sp. 1_MG-2023]|uniref:PilN domain-containing protein n=1 Tax=Alteromonas sp. 1_MG-2023 TaxID=3062669 RepID=UPI0026E24087|nr:PilN domain-containing protein [Alteromonas sp. 1_MG-2023]MDO6566685.1 PilN domain-containing protein [Alteromonas sp. 1_MG-2023]